MTPKLRRCLIACFAPGALIILGTTIRNGASVRDIVSGVVIYAVGIGIVVAVAPGLEAYGELRRAKRHLDEPSVLVHR